MGDGAAAPTLTEVLGRAKAVGFLGPGPVEDHIEHAERFGRALRKGGPAECRFADIGAGGGVPGLPLLLADRSLRGVLIDASQKRCAFLVWALAELGLSDRAEVWCGRAEALGHEDRARGRFDAVVARGFGPPPVTLECAAPLVRPGGRIVVSEPPVPRHWPADGLARLGLVQVPSEDEVAVFELRGELDPALPRSSKQQQRRPLFSLE